MFVPNTQYSISIQDYETGVESAAAFGRLTYALVRVAARHRRRALHADEDKFFRGTFDGAHAALSCRSRPRRVPDAQRFPATQVTSPTPGPRPDGTTTVPSTFASDETESFSKWTWRAALDWDVSDENFVFASFETGFKSGGFFFSNDSQVFQPEELQAFTIGSRNRLLGGRLQVDAEVFYWSYDDQQVSTIMRDWRASRTSARATWATPQCRVSRSSPIGS